MTTTLVVLVASGGSAFAASTPANVTTILSSTYGGSFTATSDGFTNGTVTATASDAQTFGAGAYSASAMASYAYNGQSFGYRQAGSADTNTVFSVAGSGTAVSGSGSFTATERFAAVDTAGGNAFSSVASENFGGADHLLAYEISGLGTDESVWALFFEDIRGGGDLDYNDLVVELRGRLGLPTTATVPAPSAAFAGLVLLVGIGARKKLIRRRLA